MKRLLLIVLLCPFYLFSQTVYNDYLNDNNIYTNAPEEVKNRKPFVREWKFFDDRAYPYNSIPQDAYVNAVKERDELRQHSRNLRLNAEWVSLGPTSGYYFSYGNISSRIVTGAYHPFNPDIIYIGPANGGVWKSTNGGINWQPLTDYQPSLSMGSIALDPVNPDIIYAGTGEATYSGVSYYGAGLLKSTDAGMTWSHKTSGLPNQTYFSRLVIRPGAGNELLAALGGAGLYRSTNSGDTWTQILSGRCDDVLFSVTGDTAFSVGSGTGLRRSVNGGATFSTFSSGLPSGTRTHFDYCLAQPAVMYASVYASSSVSAYKSTNHGINWTQVAASTNFNGGQAWYDLYCKVNPQNPDIAYIGIIDIFRTTNGGISFENITYGYSGGNVHVDQHNLVFHPANPSTILSLNDGGIYRSTNGGTSFTNLNQNLTLTQFYRITANPTAPSHILGGTQDNGTQQTYASINWAAAFGGDGGEVAFNPFNTNFILGESQNGGLVRSSNGGASWTNATSGITTSESVAWVAPIIAHPTESGVFYVARQRLYKTTNNGAAWTPISSNINSTSAVRELYISKSDPQILFATSGSRVFKSVNGGVNWTNLTSGLPARTITSVRIHPSNPDIVLLTLSGFSTNKVYKSTNGGTTWVSIHGNLPDSPVNDLVIYTEDLFGENTYFIANDVGVFITINNGVDWVELDNGLPNTVIMHLDYHPVNKMLRAGTHGRGVYELYIDANVPVELMAFTATVISNSVRLNWSTATETNNRGLEVERKLKNEEWMTIGIVGGNGTTTELKNYSFTDDLSDRFYEGKILYRLKQIDYDGTSEYSSVISAEVEYIPSEVALYQNYPNPFNPITNIAFTLPVESSVRLTVYNQLGQEISVITDRNYTPGVYNLTWDAASVTSGVYYYNLDVTDINGKRSSAVKKLIVLK
jgi:photosystem II stability/assembly factor-like uncharacterized protein